MSGTCSLFPLETPGLPAYYPLRKMIQNLENKIEIQINRLETQNEKMQEMFKKDLEEVRNSQSPMNNKITEIKYMLERTNSRVTEAGEWISELENMMPEINEAEWNKEKKKESKQMRTASEISGTILSISTFKS